MLALARWVGEGVCWLLLGGWMKGYVGSCWVGG